MEESHECNPDVLSELLSTLAQKVDVLYQQFRAVKEYLAQRVGRDWSEQNGLHGNVEPADNAPHTLGESDRFAAIEASLDAIAESTYPVVQQVKSIVDERFKDALLPLLRAIDTTEQLQLEQPSQSSALTAVANELLAVIDSLRLERYADDVFDAARQRVLSTEDTLDRALDGTIARRVCDGYRIGDRVIRPQQVILFKYGGAQF